MNISIKLTGIDGNLRQFASMYFADPYVLCRQYCVFHYRMIYDRDSHPYLLKQAKLSQYIL